MAVVSVVSLDGSTYNKDNSFMRGVFYTMIETSKRAEKAAELKAQYEAKLKDIDKEAEDILSDARRRALQNEERIVTQAKEEAARNPGESTGRSQTGKAENVR